MYVPKLFEQKNLTAIEAFLNANAFATLVSMREERLFAVHLPLFFSENKTLVGHVSKANPIWRSFEQNEEVLAIFSGPHAYVSSSWYAKINVSTWNYLAVHVYGRARLQTEAETRAALADLTAKYESSQKTPVFFEKMPDEFVKSHLNGLVGFEIEPTRIEGKWKLSQNRDDSDHANIIAELEKLGETEAALAAEMRASRPRQSPR